MSDDDDGLLHPQPDQDDLYRALVMMAVRSYTHGGFYSPAGADDQAGMLSEYHYAFGLAGGGASRPRARAFPDHPFPVRAAGGGCGVGGGDRGTGGGRGAGGRLLRGVPAGRGGAGRVEPGRAVRAPVPRRVCRRPAAPAPPAAVPGVMN
jgi:hypothetical protein